MYRFALRPKWLLFHLLVLLLVVVMVNLGIWQYHRLQSRTAFNDEVRGRFDLPAQPFERLVTPDVEPSDVEWRQATLTGTYLADEQLVVVNRGQYGAAGFDVLTPLQVDDDTLVLVDRGFLPEGTAVPAPPAGEVTVTGTLRRSEKRRLGGLTEPPGEVTEAQRIDLERLQPQMPAPLAPVFVSLVASDPAQQGDLQPVPPPELSDGPHLSYMVQWFIFSVCAVVGWVLALRRSARKRQQEAEAATRSAELSPATDAGTAPDSPPPGDDGPATAPQRTPTSSPG